MTDYVQRVIRNFKGIRSVRKGDYDSPEIISVDINNRGNVDTFQFANFESMQSDELGAFLISKMRKDQIAKIS